VVNPNLDAIQETKVALQNYDAEFGKAVAGVITIRRSPEPTSCTVAASSIIAEATSKARDPFTQVPMWRCQCYI